MITASGVIANRDLGLKFYGERSGEGEMSYTMEKLVKVDMPIATAALAEGASRRNTVTYKDIAARIKGADCKPGIMTALGQSLPGRANSKSGHVRYVSRKRK